MKKSGWVFPDNSINPINDIQTNEWYSLRAIWYQVNATGIFILRDNASFGSLFYYTPENALIVRQNCTQALVNVSCGNPAWMNVLCASSVKRTNAINILVAFCLDNNFDGAELDFEDVGEWTATQYTNFKTFVKALGTALHAQGLVLSVCVPAIPNTTYQGYYLLKYEDFNSLPVDYMTVMAYDYQWDNGAGTPTAPIQWLKDTIHWARTKITDKKRIVAGIRTQGYMGTGYDLHDRDYTYFPIVPGFVTAQRTDGELIWQSNNLWYCALDRISVDIKLQILKDMGIDSCAIWHIGNNIY